MKKVKKVIVYCTIFLIFGILLLDNVFFTHFDEVETNNPPNKRVDKFNVINQDFSEPITAATKSNYDLIMEVFENKLANYSVLGYFPQAYEPSLQATYYALYIFEALGKLDDVDHGAIARYIMSHYNSESHMFVDKYAYRYLDMDFNPYYYRLSSMLEINCYAILSLDILGMLELIDRQASIDFIWSCFNPEGSENGFIGLPYNSNLHENYKVAMMDNTYYAILTLDLLLDGWSGWSDYISERARLIQFIISLQSTDTLDESFGGFFNDNNDSFSSTGPLSIDNLLSSYFCIKSLDLFDSVNLINKEGFYEYLASVYDSSSNPFHSFQMFSFSDSYYYLYNIISTALGLQLSDLTEFSSYNREEIINFLLTYRNNLGSWDSSTKYKNHELIDMFQVIRSLKESGEISRLTSQDKNQIISAVNSHRQCEGYSLLSYNYMSINLINSIVKSFELYDKILDLDIQGLYNQIVRLWTSFWLGGTEYYYGFFSTTNMDNHLKFFWSYPIEYYNLGNYEYTNITDRFYSHESTYKALDTLQKLLRFDEFEEVCDLTLIMNGIIKSQFLKSSYKNYGGFLPFLQEESYSFATSEYLNKNVFFENSFYAIKALELITTSLDLGNITDLNFDKTALYDYITRNIVETSSTIHFDPQYTSNTEEVLENTYYMIYVLKALGLYSLDNDKIKEFVLKNLNYGDIKNIYYSYKISEILDLKIDFNHDLTISLVGTIYSEEYSDFRQNSKSHLISHDAFSWICEMAKNAKSIIEFNYTKVLYLGSNNILTASLSNMILPEFGPDLSVTFEIDNIDNIDVYILEKQSDGTFLLNFFVPKDPLFYPIIEGTINIYDKTKLIGQELVKFQTLFDLFINQNLYKDNIEVGFEFNISYKFASGHHPASNSRVFLEGYKFNMLRDTRDFTRIDFANYSRFIISYYNWNDYDLLIKLNDDYHPSSLILYDSKDAPEIPEPEEPDPEPEEPDPEPEEPDPEPEEPDPEPEEPDPEPKEPSLYGIGIMGIIVSIICGIVGFMVVKKIYKVVKWNKKIIHWLFRKGKKKGKSNKITLNMNERLRVESKTNERIPIVSFEVHRKSTQQLFED